MHELRYLILGQFIVSTCMGLAALCLFVWAAASGAFGEGEATKHRVLDLEGGDDDA